MGYTADIDSHRNFILHMFIVYTAPAYTKKYNISVAYFQRFMIILTKTQKTKSLPLGNDNYVSFICIDKKDLSKL